MIINGINIVDYLKKYENDKIIILGHDNPDVDSIVSGYLLEKLLRKVGYDVSFCIWDSDVSTESKNILAKYGFDVSVYQRKIKGDKFILVDHNERDVDGVLVGVIDHHPTSSIKNIPLYFNGDASSTASFICRCNEHYFNNYDIKLAVLALMLDTASFHSTKAKLEDRDWAIAVCQKYNIDYEDLYEKGVYNTDIEDLDRASLNGLKKYKYGGMLVESSYIQIKHFMDNEEKVNSILDIIKEYKKNNDLYMFVFIVHDLDSFKTKVYKITDGGVEIVQYDRYTSRGSTIMPRIEKELIEKFVNKKVPKI